ncbi:c-type cytochrome [Aquimarina algicola]|uniref:Cytochrome c n=1 Tax=Aquimarina algicola TaxID=2589995 RepID=A0A504J9R3_9FLAO|nr:cytochrome c [Aquimarina algicola]TPN85262.1 cytochrome c [Aquimarina algicola]
MKLYLRKAVTIISLTFVVLIFAWTQQSKSQTNNNDYIVYSSQNSELKESIARGREVYMDFCMQCHLPDGKATPNTFPPLAGSDWLSTKRKESIYAVKYGLRGAIEVNGKTYNGAMMPLGLEDEEIADVLNYVMNSWGNTQKQMVTVEEVNAIKK